MNDSGALRLINRSELLKLCGRCEGACKAEGCRISDIENSKEIDILPPPCHHACLEQLRNSPAINGSINNLLLGNHGEIIMEFLSKHSDEQYNPTALHKELGIPYNILTATLSRLCKSSKIWKHHRGFYSANCTLNPRQINKIKSDNEFFIHNIDIKILKNFHSDTFDHQKEKQPNLGTGGRKATETNEPDNNTKQQEKQQITTISEDSEIQANEVIKIAPHQKITIVEYPKNFMVMVHASENPLDIGQFFWLSSFLRLRFGEVADKGIVVKLDINDDLPMTLSPNQLTFGNLSGMCIAVYGKGNLTRMELRNYNPHIPLTEFLEKLLAFSKISPSKQVSYEAKATENNGKQQETTSAKISPSKQVSDEAKVTESNQKQQEKQPIATSNYLGEQVCGE